MKDNGLARPDPISTSRFNLRLCEAEELTKVDRLDGARELCNEVLAEDDSNARAHHLLGLTAIRRGALADALASLRTAAESEPENAAILNDLSNCYVGLGRNDEAIHALREAVSRDPTCAVAHFNIGNLLLAEGNLQEALSHYETGLAIAPDMPEAHYNIGLVYFRLDMIDEAVASFRAALDLAPDFADAHCALGNALFGLDRISEARKAYRKALRYEPAHEEAKANLRQLIRYERYKAAAKDRSARPRGSERTAYDFETYMQRAREHYRRGRLNAAVRLFRCAVSSRPASTEAREALRQALETKSQLPKALAYFEKCMDGDPRPGRALYNQGVCLMYLGRMDAAIDRFEHTLELEPGNKYFHMASAHSLLKAGRLREGFAELEWRKKLRYFKNIEQGASAPVWNGSELPGKTILIRAEWGSGDVFQFARFIPFVRERCEKVVFEVYPQIGHLFREMEGVEVVARGSPLPSFDVWVPLGSLLHLFELTLDTIPTRMGYLAVDRKRVERLGGMLAHTSGPKVGLCWRSSSDFALQTIGASRSMRVGYFADTIRRPDIVPVCLQKRDAGDDLSKSDLARFFFDFGFDLDHGDDAFIDTAAVIENLDLVITCDTSIAHLAAILERPVWLLLPFACDWRWLSDRDDSPWYPTVQLFRQPRRGIWSDVIFRVQNELDAFLAGKSYREVP